jgi:FKBP-type peptidyl-prolyl cis-trans isomerase SlyD
MQNLEVKKGKVVTLGFVLTDDQGVELDRADRNEPFLFLHGSNQIVPGLENGLTGLTIGDKKKIVVSPAEAYGEVNPDLVLSVSNQQFPKGTEIEVGMKFVADLDGGEEAVFTIRSIAGEKVVIDANHDLAGMTLTFDIEVLDVRDPTADELAHGHAHGPGEHHH